jgi:uncharacterized membrane protein YgaE (UPF0421/DUF939 family)
MTDSSTHLTETKYLFIRRILLTSLGVTFAWYIGSFFEGADSLVAGIMCLITLQFSVQSSLKEGISQLLGSSLGAGSALILVLTVGNELWVVSVVIVLSIVIAKVFKLGGQGSLNVGITALIILGPGSAVNTASDRVWGTVIGVTVGIIVSYWIRPDTPAQRTQKALVKVSLELADLLQVLSDKIESGFSKKEGLDLLEQARDLNYKFDNIKLSTSESVELSKWNPRASRSEAQALVVRTQALEHVAVQVRILCRNLLEYSISKKEVSDAVRTELVSSLKAASKALISESSALEKSPKILAESSEVRALSTQIENSASKIKQSDDTQELILGLGVIANMNIIEKSLSLETPAVPSLGEDLWDDT